ncbi:MAG: radical SAM protein [Paludibacteraceae bacterium]|nr:radical SAM protein [Paludibacteraceae bacterium]MBQ4018013.1 radical SAM protein [Paludibacteraceae bacterium]
MANLYLTHHCNRGCPFCFARKVLAQRKNRDEILTVEDITKLLDHYHNRFQAIGLLGGEPFLYPHLAEVINLLHERHIPCKIFTSATNPMPKELEEMPASVDYLSFVVNVGERNTYRDDQFQNLEHFFDKFHEVSTLSFTIFDLNADPTFLFDMIDKYQLSRAIRTGIALPIYQGGNKYIMLDEYKKAGEYMIKCVDQAAARRITMNMDCGFQACMFTDEQRGHLLRHGSHMEFVCGAAVDIGPGLQAWNCFPLFQLGYVNALDADNEPDLTRLLQEQVAKEMGCEYGVRPECKDCEFMQHELCQGGCRSFNSIK